MVARFLPAFCALSMLPAPAFSLTMKAGTAWPGTEIPVCWESPKREHAQERDLIRKSAGWTWEKESAVRFTGWRACKKNSPGIHIALQAKYPQTRGRGRELDGMKDGMILPSLWSLTALSVNLKAPVHEFGHALGFGHEYARADAPDLERCSVKDARGRPYVETDDPLTPFDPDSIMIACVPEATLKFSLGTPSLSALDIFGLVGIYGSHPDNILDTDEAGDRFGAALVLDDLDGDGTPDLAVAAPGEDEGAGAIYLFRGDKVSGFRPHKRLDPSAPDMVQFPALAAMFDAVPPPIPADFDAPDLDSASAQLRFPDLADAAGEDLIILSADLNEDGIPDRIIGAPQATGGAAGSGAVIVLRGHAQDDGPPRYSAWYWFGQSY